MSARWNSTRLLASVLGVGTFICVAAAVRVPRPSASLAGGARVLIDPGHNTNADCSQGAGSNCLGQSACMEAKMNWKVGYRVYWYLRNVCGFEGVTITRTSEDDCPTWSQRAAMSNATFPKAFVSVHHNGCLEDGTIPSNGFTEWCSQATLADPFGYISSEQLADAIASKFSHIGGYSMRNPWYCEDLECSNRHLTVLQLNHYPATLGEPYSVMSAMATDLCRDTGAFLPSALITESDSYMAGINLAVGPTSVGTSFTAEQAPGSGIQLAWQESDPERSVTYVLWRSDSCWGPFNQIAAIPSSGITTYAYLDTSCPYWREYFYLLTVTGERVRASAWSMASFLIPHPPEVPTGLTAEHLGGSTVNLNWTAPTGPEPVSGYHVYRSLYQPAPSCEANHHEYIGSTTLTSYEDTSAPHGLYVSYLVAAYNAEGISDVSNAVDGSTTTDVAEREVVGRVVPAACALSVRDSGTGRPTILFEIAETDHITLGAYDVRGRLVTVLESKNVGPGRHSIVWDGRQSDGRSVASGVYFARLFTRTNRVACAKFVLVR